MDNSVVDTGPLEDMEALCVEHDFQPKIVVATLLGRLRNDRTQMLLNAARDAGLLVVVGVGSSGLSYDRMIMDELAEIQIPDYPDYTEDPPKQRTYGPPKKGKKGKVKRW